MEENVSVPEESNILYHITNNQAELLAKYYNKDINTLEEYEICELLDAYIDEIIRVVI